MILRVSAASSAIRVDRRRDFGILLLGESGVTGDDIVL